MTAQKHAVTLSFEDVIDLLSIDNLDQWDASVEISPPYLLKPNGIYAKKAFRIPEFTVEVARLFRPWFPPGEYGNYVDPICELPCDVEAFLRFVDGANLWDRVMYPDGSFIALWTEMGLPARTKPANRHPQPNAVGTPPLLKTPAMAQAFSGLWGWKYQKWSAFLGDSRPRWKEFARIKGPGRPNPDLWHPVKLAIALLGRDETLFNSISVIFANRPELEAWRGEWESHAQHWSD